MTHETQHDKGHTFGASCMGERLLVGGGGLSDTIELIWVVESLVALFYQFGLISAIHSIFPVLNYSFSLLHCLHPT